MSYLKINGVSVKAPKNFKSTIQDIDGQSTRTAAGTMTRDRIAVKRKLECEWGPLSPSEMSQILKAINGVFFPIDYPDPETGSNLTRTFYAGDRSATIYSFNEKYQRMMWQGLTVNFIEQ